MDKKTEKKTKELLKEVPKQFKDIVLTSIEYAKEHHGDEERYGGQPMIEHVVNVGLLANQTNLDTNSIIASILHEIPLDSKKEKEIEEKFSKDVLDILKRLKEIRNATNTNETPDEIIVKYILNSSNDLRPVIIKVLDTLCDMRSVENIPKDMKKSSLKKALNVYAVLAEYLDLNEIKKEIEESAFREHMPIECKSITKKMEEAKVNNKTLEKYKKLLDKILNSLHFEKKIQGRIKCKYSIYKKLKKYEKEWINPNIQRVDDLIAFRILTNSEEDCFLVLEKLMDNGEPNYDLFDDYISNPKPNGYKAIQFPVKFNTVSDLNIEIQIMTHEMFYYNTYGPASHIAYKASKSRYAKPTNEYSWIEDIHKQMKKSRNERRNKISIPIQCNIYKDEVFAFTPKGMILDLNKGDTVLDFAFKLHTEIGNSTIGALVNGKAAKISSPLETGDIVEIKTDKNKKYQKIEALKSVNSDSSKLRIRNQLSKQKRKG